jgi:hypothetical protein
MNFGSSIFPGEKRSAELLESKKGCALYSVIKIVLVGITGKLDWSHKLYSDFNAIIALRWFNHRVGRHAIFWRALHQLIFYPAWRVTLGRGDIHVVLHQVFE